MRVLHVIPSVAPRDGGPSAAVGPMCRSLIDRGVDAWLLATNADGHSELAVPLGTPTNWQGVPTLFFKRDISESFKYSSSLARWLRGHVAEFDIVHVHAVLSHACLSAAAACRRSGIPYVLRPLGTLAPWSLRQKGLKKRIILALGGRRAVDGAGGIHCTSEEERRGIVTAFPNARTVVIPLGVDSALLDAPEVSWSARHDDPYVLAISRLHPKKNLEAVIDAFAAVAPRQSEPWRLVIAGAGDLDYSESLRAFARQRGAERLVTFPGWVDGEGKHELMRHASVLVLASRHENFGVSVLEAMACGVAPLVSRNVDLANAIKAAGAGWVIDTSVESIRDGLSEALGNGTERSARGRAARKLARHFSWSDIAETLVNLYQRLSPGGAPLAYLPSAVKAGR